MVLDKNIRKGSEIMSEMNSPYGPSHYEMHKQKKKAEIRQKENNLLLKQIAHELNGLSVAVASIQKTISRQDEEK